MTVLTELTVHDVSIRNVIRIQSIHTHTTYHKMRILSLTDVITDGFAHMICNKFSLWIYRKWNVFKTQMYRIWNSYLLSNCKYVRKEH